MTEWEELMETVAEVRAKALTKGVQNLGAKEDDGYTYDVDTEMISPGRERVTLSRIEISKVGEFVLDYRVALDGDKGNGECLEDTASESEKTESEAATDSLKH